MCFSLVFVFSFSVPSVSGMVRPRPSLKHLQRRCNSDRSKERPRIHRYFCLHLICFQCLVTAPLYGQRFQSIFLYKFFILQLWCQYLRQPSGIRRRTLIGWVYISCKKEMIFLSSGQQQCFGSYLAL